MAKREAIFEVQLEDNGGKLSFYDFDEIQAFIARERGFYRWLSEGATHAGNYMHNAVSSWLKSLQQGLSNWQGGGGTSASVKQAFVQVYQQTRLPVSTTPTAEFISDLKDQHGVAVAAAALSVFTNQTLNRDQPGVMRGMNLAFAFQDGINPNTARSTKRALDKLSTEFGNGLAELRKTVIDQAERFAKAEAHNKRFVQVMSRWTEHRLRMHMRRADERLAESVKDFQKVQATYEEFMKIKAPVDYWKGKGAEHRRSAKRYRTLLLWFAGIAGVLLLVGLGLLSNRAIDLASAAKDQPPALFIILGAIGVVMTTMVFWAARLIVRLFMSEHHLAIDAEERATMAMTYLALTENKGAEEKDRAIVLAALFRPTTDGIVKDDAAPDLGPASLLSKVLEKR
ncbi:MAG TPA: DUF6161 domain-containing protein [Microvirga sp.]|nr:DUF6161 domain-containing protein [Microvirga sp.]